LFIEDIDSKALENVTSAERWGADTHRDRFLYRDEKFYYKIWGDNYIATTCAAVGSSFKGVKGLRNIHGFEVGLYVPEVSKALVDFITDEGGRIRGYVTHRGTHPSEVPESFVDALFESSVKSGWVYSDLKPQNLVVFNGTCSLIDFDTHLSCLQLLDIEFEKEHGCLRAFTSPLYRAKILEFLGRSTEVY